MKFHSTNYLTSEVDFKTVILTGQARDKGLYMPNEIPKLSSEQIYSLKNKNFNEIALNILTIIVKDSIPKNIFRTILKSALNFEVPVEKIQTYDYLLYLSKGPTCSFKDFGARTLARLMEYFLNIENKDIIILTATSGDTGGAVAHAFYEMKHINVVILYPEKEISELQRKQMTTLGKNISAIGIDGKFDDCQKYVKRAFSDKDLKTLNLSSANSINFGRLLPQCIYYFWSYLQIVENQDEKVIFSVPSGNFGNLMGGLLSYKMGLPVKIFISAVNENNEFPRYLSSGIYKKVIPSKNCISNAMNVGHPSNLARIFDLYGGRMDENGIITKEPNLEQIRNIIISYSINDDLTRRTITDFYKKHERIIEPHGAVGWAALQIYKKKFPKDRQYKAICFETADPAKFPSEIENLTGKSPELPNSLSIVRNKKEYTNMRTINKYQDFKNFLRKNFIQ